MNYSGFMPNDFIDGEGVCVSLWTQGCGFHCKGCHNPESWDFNGGYKVPTNLEERLCNAITANGFTRNFSVLGGEPLWPSNREFVTDIVKKIRNRFKDIKIFLWTGYEFEDIKDLEVLNYIDVLIVGPYIDEQRDITLKLRGSTNQRILYKGKDF